MQFSLWTFTLIHETESRSYHRMLIVHRIWTDEHSRLFYGASMVNRIIWTLFGCLDDPSGRHWQHKKIIASPQLTGTSPKIAWIESGMVTGYDSCAAKGWAVDMDLKRWKFITFTSAIRWLKQVSILLTRFRDDRNRSAFVKSGRRMIETSHLVTEGVIWGGWGAALPKKKEKQEGREHRKKRKRKKEWRELWITSNYYI